MAPRIRPVYLLIFVILLLSRQSLSLFTEAECWPGTARCIQRSADTDSWCYVAVARDSTSTTCVGGAVDFQGVLAAHIGQDLSIAYYDGASNRRLGGASEYNLTDTVGVIRLCASGMAGNGVLYTICTNVAADNQFSGSPACVVVGGPTTVSDGCYNLARPQTSMTTTSASRTSSTTTSSTSTSTTRTSSSSQPETTSSSTSSKEETSTSPSVTVITPTIIVNNMPAPTPKVDKGKDIAVPIVVALLGVVAAALGAGFWKKRQNSRLQAQHNANQNAIAQVAGAVQRVYV